MKRIVFSILLMLFAFMANAQEQVMVQISPGFNQGEKFPDTSKDDVTMHWDGENEFGFQLMGGGDLTISAQFDQTDLTAYGVVGGQIISIVAWIMQMPISVTVRIYDEIDGSPGNVVYSEDVTSITNEGDWNTYTLSTPFDIDGSTFFIALNTLHGSDCYPVGVDAGPAVSKGDLFQTGDDWWVHLGDIGLSYSFNIRAVATIITDIADIENAEISIYPNPSDGIFSIAMNGTYNLEIVDVTGRLVESTEFTDNAEIDISTEIKGIYFLKFFNENGTAVKKIMIK